jgi:hypothetical protein
LADGPDAVQTAMLTGGSLWPALGTKVPAPAVDGQERTGAVPRQTMHRGWHSLSIRREHLRRSDDLGTWWSSARPAGRFNRGLLRSAIAVMCLFLAAHLATLVPAVHHAVDGTAFFEVVEDAIYLLSGLVVGARARPATGAGRGTRLGGGRWRPSRIAGLPF